jgi:ABC-2 type transport system permease protein
MACPSQPPCRFDTKVESQIQHSEKPADSVNPENALVSQLWFRIPFAGSYLTLYAGLALFLAAAVGIGLMLSAVVATMQQAMLYAFVIMMPLTLLSGLATPVSSMPQALQYLTLINPLRYVIDITRRVYLEGGTLGQLFPDLWPMAVIAAATLSAAAWMFRNGLE